MHQNVGNNFDKRDNPTSDPTVRKKSPENEPMNPKSGGFRNLAKGKRRNGEREGFQRINLPLQPELPVVRPPRALEVEKNLKC